ncbi:putative sporulation protein YtaF [Sporomusaceae bacterium BoRhaA]|uniref:sporulation membrane protein YtaF n=1 Tax=Pelorhabdus rhamnosifermentans TaxID=2772457 RepID=UPI001C060781|nr:sporulation membrane protein YtaF [Pelorhabdus rhamnosifermentans]MBU2702191.1 putative sporulation protein YtaF [Pelorhabdus rhamnosifermentans]
MDFLSVILLAISSNLDNLGVGISYGTRQVKIPWKVNLIIALMTSVGTMLSMTFGSYIADSLNPTFSSAMGSLIIMGAGGWVIFLDRHHGRLGRDRGPVSIYDVPQSIVRVLDFLKEPLRADLDASGTLSLYEGSLLGLALTINNVSSGVGAGMAGVNAMFTTMIVFILSIVMLSGGLLLGSSFAARWLGDKAGLVGGFLLIFIGLFEFLH